MMSTTLLSPEAWMRERQRDLYLIPVHQHSATPKFYYAEEESFTLTIRITNESGIRTWLATNLPDVAIHGFTASEYEYDDGPENELVYLGGSFSKREIAMLQKAGWQLQHMAFVDWLDQLEQFPLLSPDNLPKTFMARWWESTDQVILVGANEQGMLPSVEDAWHIAKKVVSFSRWNSGSLDRGRCWVSEHETTFTLYSLDQQEAVIPTRGTDNLLIPHIIALRNELYLRRLFRIKEPLFRF